MRRQVWGLVVRIFAVSVMLAAAVGTARAGWADRLFSEQGHDFGPIPRGARLRHSFVLTNRFAEPVTIEDVRASCGCTTGRPSATLIPPGASATVEAEMDTRNFVGKKATTLYVAVGGADGRESEVRLGVSATILSDIVLNPGTIDLGAVARGQTPSQTLTIERVGMPNWQVSRMVSACQAIEASLTETARNGQTVGYLLQVSIRPDAPAGTVRDEIQLVTNDPETPSFSIHVAATVRGNLSASPALLSLGTATSAGSLQGRFLVRASRPFVVRSIAGEGDGFKAQADSDAARPVHFVTVSYRPEDGTTRGDLRHAFRLHTDLDGEAPLELTATVRVDP